MKVINRTEVLIAKSEVALPDKTIRIINVPVRIRKIHINVV